MSGKESYFVISVDEDGGILIRQFSQESLEAEMNDPMEPLFLGSHVFEAIPNVDPMTWRSYNSSGRLFCIIKGEMVVPKAIEVVTKYKI